jgi:VIT1/CCC1 family predicted Fe2+/Mn2+ transporter
MTRREGNKVPPDNLNKKITSSWILAMFAVFTVIILYSQFTDKSPSDEIIVTVMISTLTGVLTRSIDAI